LHVTRAKSGPSGIRVRATRADDLTGVSLRVALIDHPIHAGGNRGGWTYTQPGGGSGVSQLEYGQREDAWQDEAREVDVALAAPARKEVVLRFSVARIVD
jgi:hypothetical protein